MTEKEINKIYLIIGIILFVLGLATFSYNIYLGAVIANPGVETDTQEINSIVSPILIAGGLFFIIKSRKKKGQAATEFLMTYGWAIFGAVIVVSTIAYMGLFNNGQITQISSEEEIVLSPPFEAPSGNADKTGNDLELNLDLNNEGIVPIEIESATVEGKTGGEDLICTLIEPTLYELRLALVGGDAADSVTITTHQTETTCTFAESPCIINLPENTPADIVIDTAYTTITWNNPSICDTYLSTEKDICQLTMTGNKVSRISLSGFKAIPQIPPEWDSSFNPPHPEEEYDEWFIIESGENKQVQFDCGEIGEEGEGIDGDLVVNYKIVGSESTFKSTGKFKTIIT